MPDPITRRTPPTRPGWTARLLRAVRPRRAEEEAHQPPPASGAELACRFIAAGRYALVLRADGPDGLPATDFERARQALRQRMALVPTGRVGGTSQSAAVPAFYLDRHAVTHRQFLRFVDAGAYDDLELWPHAIWPSLMKFTDRTRRPGPRDWSDGAYPAGLADHPVTGVSWYEAAAFAAWAGKRLPTAAEWDRAASWPDPRGGPDGGRYPWGAVFEPGRANLAAAGRGKTVTVDAYPDGATPNGLHQLTGNVWEWLADRLDALPDRPGARFDPDRPLRRVIGGAYDTILPAEATCRFVTGQGELDRRPNLGFRCALAADKLRAED